MPASTASRQARRSTSRCIIRRMANDGPYAGVNCAVSVEINVPQTTTWFLKLFNAPSGMPITTQAVALMENNNPGCIFLLNPSVAVTFTGANISASSCALADERHRQRQWREIAMSRRLAMPAARCLRAAPTRNATPTPMVPMADPCPDITGCANIAANPPSSSGCTALTQSGGTISPGCYSSLALSGAITLSPGTYVLTGTTSLTGRRDVAHWNRRYLLCDVERDGPELRDRRNRLTERSHERHVPERSLLSGAEQCC